MTVASFRTRSIVLEDTRPLVERYQEEVAAGASTSLTAHQFKELMAYRLAVRDTDNGAELPITPTFVAPTV